MRESILEILNCSGIRIPDNHTSHRDMLNPLDSDGVRAKTEEWSLVVDRL